MGLVYMPGICRECGCDDDHACVDPGTGAACTWVEEDLCSACAPEALEPDPLVDEGDVLAGVR